MREVDILRARIARLFGLLSSVGSAPRQASAGSAVAVTLSAKLWNDIQKAVAEEAAEPRKCDPDMIANYFGLPVDKR